uniref:Putative chitin deacetylase n=1 Tax=Flammulina velutipes TaxID=38945 RepID=G8A526_FLAVE|nr:putative chitin deacetylase [Flammulina velutipes]
MFASALLTFCLAALATVKAAPQPVSPVKRQSPSLIYSCTQPNTAAISFDDGPYDYIYDIVNTLNSKGAKGTFFMRRCMYDQDSQDRIKYAFNNGHQIASHTWSHPNMVDLSWDQLHNEMWRVEEALQRIIGVTPAFIRPPYGNFNDQVLQAAYSRGQNVVIWDFDSGDTVGADAQESKNRYDQVANQRPNTIMALNHEVVASTAYDVLPYAIDRLQSAGYQLVTVAECLGMEPYQNVGQAQTNDENLRQLDWTLRQPSCVQPLFSRTLRAYHWGEVADLTSLRWSSINDG